MLEGIHILNQIEIKVMPNWCIILAIVIAIIIFLAMLIYDIVKKNDFVFGGMWGLFFGFVGFLFLIIILNIIIPKVPTEEYKYQVTIDETVSFKEFDEKYNVVKQEGEIYTIVEK